MPDRCFVAINFSQFHSLDAVFDCVRSVSIAADNLSASSISDVIVIVFDHSADGMSISDANAIRSSGVEVRRVLKKSNGAGLNAQISAAICGGYDLFFRVDADDPVHPSRFVRQTRHLEKTGADIAGGGLIYQDMQSGERRPVLPKKHPNVFDFITNSYMLHPTWAIRLASLDRHQLKYWDGRLEDKMFLISAVAAGLTMTNDQIFYGEYNFSPNARSSLEFACLNLRLNLKFIFELRNWLYIPVAFFVFGLSCTLPSGRLRNLRNTFIVPKPIAPKACDGSEVTGKRR